MSIRIRLIKINFHMEINLKNQDFTFKVLLEDNYELKNGL